MRIERKKYLELEHLRSFLYKYVNEVPSRLSSSVVLKASMLLDDLIMEVQKEKQEQKTPSGN